MIESKESKSLIISDLHLCGDDELFSNFCQKIAPNYDNLFILGDLFNVYLGDDLIDTRYQKIVDLLKNLSQFTDIFIMTGNRDFLIGTTFAKKANIQLIKEPYIFADYVLLHGDNLVIDDRKYQILKTIIQNPLVKFLIKNTTKNFRQNLATKLRKISNNSKGKKTTAIMDVNSKFCDKFMQKYPKKHLIHGHTHKKNIHSHQDFKRFVLGDWSTNKGNGLEIIAGKIQFIEIT